MAAKKRGAKKGKKRGTKPKGGVQAFALVSAKVLLAHPDPAKARALKAFLRTGTVVAACNAAGIGRATWYDWLHEDALFARLAAEANDHVTDALEQEMLARATREVDASDTLLIFALKARRPDTYRDRRVLTDVSVEVRMRVQQTLQLIASKPSWDSEDLINQLTEVWK